MPKANLLLKNDVGLVLDITESPLACTVYDLEGNEISGSGGGAAFVVTISDGAFDKTAGEIIENFEAGSSVIIVEGIYTEALLAITKDPDDTGYWFHFYSISGNAIGAYGCTGLDQYPYAD